MSTKKKKAPAAQNLIDSLLDEKTPKSSKPAPEPSFDLFEASEPSTYVLQEASSANVGVIKGSDESSSKVFDPGALSSPDLPDLLDLKLNHGPFDPTDDRTQVVPLPKKKSQDTGANAPANVNATTVRSSMPSADSGDDASLDRWLPTELKTVVRPSGGERPKSSGSGSGSIGAVTGAILSAEAALKQSESLRIAQSRISGLEHELERLRRDNEQLTTAGETLRRRSDELLSKTESLELQSKENSRMFEEEKKIFRGQIQQKERENLELRGRIEEMESRLESNFKKIRVRERELEHRLEIIKMESATLVSTKDKMILDLKRQIDQLTHENEYAKQKTQELFKQYKDKQETIRRVVRALRIALTVLEGDEDAAPLKKAE